MKFKLSRYIYKTDVITEKKGGDTFRLFFSTRTGKILRLPEWLHDQLEQLPVDQLPDRVVNRMLDLEMLVPEEENELTYIINKNKAVHADLGCMTLLLDATHVKKVPPLIKATLSRMIARNKLKLINMVWLIPEGFSAHHDLVRLAGDYETQLRGVPVRKQLILDIHQFPWLKTLGRLPESTDRLELIISDIDAYLESPAAEATLKDYFSCSKTWGDKCSFRLKILGRHIEMGTYREWVPRIQEWSAGSRVEILIIPTASLEEIVNEQLIGLVRYINSATRFPIYLVPAVSAKHLTAAARRPRRTGLRQYLLTTDELAERQDYSQTAFPSTLTQRSFVTRDFEQQLLKGEVRCSNCNFLPFCGGCEKTLWDKGQARCPPYKEHFTGLLKIISKID
jgi:radical SAM protein with 4Fe4S-binding SPASM domain